MSWVVDLQLMRPVAAVLMASIVGRPCIVNRQGFADNDDFVVGDDFGSRMRMMMMGDSFTQGYSADIGNSYVEYIEAIFPEFIVWNTAISGNGTNRAATDISSICANS